MCSPPQTGSSLATATVRYVDGVYYIRGHGVVTIPSQSMIYKEDGETETTIQIEPIFLLTE